MAYARAVCDQARVPLKVVPLTKQYWERVVAHSLGEIAAGRTPNPDVLCNSRIKFGAFLEHIATTNGDSFDRVASGHYARVERGVGLEPALRLSADEAKDQTYFLAGLSQQQLAAAMFPLGGCAAHAWRCVPMRDVVLTWRVASRLPKPSVRQLAAEGRLPTAVRKDSQGICFLGKVCFTALRIACFGMHFACAAPPGVKTCFLPLFLGITLTPASWLVFYRLSSPSLWRSTWATARACLSRLRPGLRLGATAVSGSTPLASARALASREGPGT